MYIPPTLPKKNFQIALHGSCGKRGCPPNASLPAREHAIPIGWPPPFHVEFYRPPFAPILNVGAITGNDAMCVLLALIAFVFCGRFWAAAFFPRVHLVVEVVCFWLPRNAKSNCFIFPRVIFWEARCLYPYTTLKSGGRGTQCNEQWSIDSREFCQQGTNDTMTATLPCTGQVNRCSTDSGEFRQQGANNSNIEFEMPGDAKRKTQVHRGRLAKHFERFFSGGWYDGRSLVGSCGEQPPHHRMWMNITSLRKVLVSQVAVSVHRACRS